MLFEVIFCLVHRHVEHFALFLINVDFVVEVFENAEEGLARWTPVRRKEDAQELSALNLLNAAVFCDEQTFAIFVVKSLLL